jgi:hypothetical protein
MPSKLFGIILLVFYLSVISIVISMVISITYGQEYDKDYFCDILLKALDKKPFEPTIMTGNLTPEQQILLKQYCSS